MTFYLGLLSIGLGCAFIGSTDRLFGSIGLWCLIVPFWIVLEEIGRKK